MKTDGKIRCSWCNENNPKYVKYHDTEWGIPCFDDQKIYELFLLEPQQAGLSWECVLNKREAFREAFDSFDPVKIAEYGEEKIASLLTDKKIIRNRRKISATIKNAVVFLKIKEEFGSFSSYIWNFTDGKVIRENDKTTSPLSDRISTDLKRRGASFVGSTVVYSFLQAIGIINSHEDSCFLKGK